MLHASRRCEPSQGVLPRSPSHNIPLDLTVHHTPSGYMDRDGWLKSMTQFSNICGASPVNNQILFSDGHDSHFDDRTLTKTQIKNIHPFILQSGESINDQTNDNGPNSKRKALYNISKAKWMLKYGTTRFQPQMRRLQGIIW